MIVATSSLGLGACDQTSTYQGPYDEGDPVTVAADGPARPDSREGYARLAAFTIGGTYVALIDPGTGPDDPPRFARLIEMPEVIHWTAQVDEDGFLWLAAPDDGGSGAALPVMYVIDPHRAVIQREIWLPSDLRGVAHVLATPETVYLRPWRDGFSGAVGALDRACATDPTRCEPRLLADFGNVGISGEYAFHIRGDTLYSFSTANSRDRRASLDLIDVRTGTVLRSSPLASGSFTVRPDAIHQVVTVPLEGTARRLDLLRLDPVTLAVEARVPAAVTYIARQGDRVYAAPDGRSGTILVYDAATLELVETREVALDHGIVAVFGFVAPDVLLLDAWTAMDVRTGALMEVGTPRVWNFANGLMLPQGHPLAR